MRIAISRPKRHNLTEKTDRNLFWLYAVRAAGRTRNHCRTKGLPHDIDEHFIDEMLVTQHWRCAVSKVPLVASTKGGGRDPFGPSIDRIVPALGYVRGNVRIVANIVNFAMNEYGEQVFRELCRKMVTPPRVA